MRYLISGYYGEGNAGDEAILAGILRALQSRDPEAEFTVLSFSPEDTERRHRVEAIPTGLRDPRPLLRALRGADILISGGGSFLHEADLDLYGHSFLWREGKLRPVPYFLSVVLAARALGVPVMWYAQGPQQRSGVPQTGGNGLHPVAPLRVLGGEREDGELRLRVPGLQGTQDAGQDGLVAGVPLPVVSTDQIPHLFLLTAPGSTPVLGGVLLWGAGRTPAPRPRGA